MSRASSKGKATGPEIFTSVVGIAFTVVLVSFATYEGVRTRGEASASVSISEVQTQPDGTREVLIEVANDGGHGLLQVGVRVECGEDPIDLYFDNLPVEDRRRANVLCPPGDEPPQAKIIALVAA